VRAIAIPGFAPCVILQRLCLPESKQVMYPLSPQRSWLHNFKAAICLLNNILLASHCNVHSADGNNFRICNLSNAFLYLTILSKQVRMAILRILGTKTTRLVTSTTRTIKIYAGYVLVSGDEALYVSTYHQSLSHLHLSNSSSSSSSMKRLVILGLLAPSFTVHLCT
jgi:hypothetical protein